MFRGFVLLSACVSTFFSCDGDPGLRSRSAGSKARGLPLDLEFVLERIRERHGLPGLAAAIVRQGDIVASAAVGVRRMGSADRLELHDRFHIASCTKSMTATLAAILVEEGRLEWTSRLVDIVPQLREVVRPEYRSATLERLLAHAALMPAYTQFGPRRLQELTSIPGSPTEQRLTFLAEVLASESPNRGTGDGAYSNVGYTAAAVMMERVTGESWEELILDRLLGPLGMSEVGFGWPATTGTPEQPRGHFEQDGRVVEQPLDDSYVLPVVLWPAGAVNSSIGDLGRYAADHLDGLQGRPAILPGAAYQRLHSTLDENAEGFTLGWGIRDDPDLGVVHYGAGSGGTFFVRIVIVPALDTAIVVASNSGEAGAATREVVDSWLTASGRSARSAARSRGRGPGRPLPPPRGWHRARVPTGRPARSA